MASRNINNSIILQLHSMQLSVQCTELGAKTAMEATLAEVISKFGDSGRW